MTNRDDTVDTYSHNNVNEYNQMVMDINGSNVTKTPLYDDAGNLSQDHEDYLYAYDYENRLTRIYKMDGEDEVDVAEYEYDALGRRIQKIEHSGGSPSSTTRYYYDGWRVLAETNEYDIVQREYVYGNYLDEVLVMTDSSDDHYYAHDHLFSPVALIDEDGDILERYEYDAYGKCTFLDSGFNPLGTQESVHGNTRLFTGQVLDILDDGDFIVMYYKNRYYLVGIGRFIQRDPLGAVKLFHIAEYQDGMCLYEYVGNNPLQYNDLYGLSKAKINCTIDGNVPKPLINNRPDRKFIDILTLCKDKQYCFLHISGFDYRTHERESSYEGGSLSNVPFWFPAGTSNHTRLHYPISALRIEYWYNYGHLKCPSCNIYRTQMYKNKGVLQIACHYSEQTDQIEFSEAFAGTSAHKKLLKEAWKRFRSILDSVYGKKGADRGWILNDQKYWLFPGEPQPVKKK